MTMAEGTSQEAVRAAAREFDALGEEVGGPSETAAKLRELGFEVRGLGDDHNR